MRVKSLSTQIISFVMILFLTVGMFSPLVHASDITDEKVQDVISQLEAIDTLQEMQNKRKANAVKSKYVSTTTDSAIIEAHESARIEYETYVSDMFAARKAAQIAYDNLSASQQALIDSSLVAKLDNTLDTVFHSDTFSITPASNEYIYEVVYDKGAAYEVSNHIAKTSDIPAIFMLVDTSDGKTSWTPDGKYVVGKSNFEAVYCCDAETALVNDTHYKRVNLEDSTYYSEACARRIRAIVQNSYPYISLEEMKSNLKASGLDKSYVDSLTRSDIIAAVQLAIWGYSNPNFKSRDDVMSYNTTYDMTINGQYWMRGLHDYTNELWDWWSAASRATSYDARAEYRVNNLVYYLCNLEGQTSSEDQIIVSDVQISRADLISKENGTYRVGMYVTLNCGADAKDNLVLTASTISQDGQTTAKTRATLTNEKVYELTIDAKYGDTIKVVVEGSQHIEKGVYLYEAEGGFSTSQTLVGVSSGNTKIRAEKSFVFEEDIERGLRIYKSATDSDLPISDITFHVYHVVLAEGDKLSDKPTDAEVAKYATAENKVGAITTDETGYGAITLDEGTYLVVEEHNKDKVKAPAAPFYICVPWPVENKTPSGDIEIEYQDIVSIYPKNEPIVPPPPPPPPPPSIDGSLAILKHDSNDTKTVLKGAEFKLYKAATDSDTNVEIITCNGIQCAVVPVIVNGNEIILKTGADGKAVADSIPCGTYYLVETKAPNGYMKSEEAFSVHVYPNGTNSQEVYYIPNELGNVLPETGGMGTNLFVTVGGLMVLFAVVLLVTKKRMHSV